jgi:hypothetical protein
MNVEPSLSYTGEGVLNDFLKSSNPALLTGVKLDLSNARGLYLLEFFDTEGLTLHGNIKDTVVMEELIVLRYLLIGFLAMNSSSFCIEDSIFSI